MTREYFAEMYVAGLLADAGWNFYFPHGDKGDRAGYGYSGQLSVLHPAMALILVFLFAGRGGRDSATQRIHAQRSDSAARTWHRCVRSNLQTGRVTPRRDFQASMGWAS